MKIRLLLLLIMTCCWSANAQIPGEPRSVQGPNAASLGQYGEVPISLFTGLPNLEIPLYTVQEGGIKVPLSLNYHASGFRPEVHPGWVGMGWNLNAGGAISRTVHDGPDEYNNAGRGGASGYYYSYGLLSAGSWSDMSTVQGLAQTPSYNHKDTEPDEFAFNFGEYSGKFYLSSTGSWKVKCNKPLTVAPYLVTVNNQSSYFLDAAIPLPQNHNYIHTGASKTFAGFVITTEDGTQYIFGGVTTAIEYQVDLFNQLNREWVAGTWNLTQIIHPDGHKVSFIYERINGIYISQMYYSISGTVFMKVQNTPGGGFFDINPSVPCSNFSTIPSYYSSTAGKLISPVYLTKIVTTLCTIKFERAQSVELRYQESTGLNSAYHSHYVPFTGEMLTYLMQGSPYLIYPDCLTRLQWQELTAISIATTPTATRQAQVIKKFLFGYNNNSNERLTLLTLTEQGSSSSSAKPPYRFGYNKYHSLIGYLFDQIDHWGFYNANYIATGNAYPDMAGYYAHREPSQDSAVYLAGMLTRIIYPTGGVTELQYEQHRFGAQLNANRFSTPTFTSSQTPTGGVRIKKIISYSSNSPTQKLEKEYFYVTGYTPSASAYDLAMLPSSGVLGGQARYSWGNYKARSYNQSSAVYSRSIFSTQSVLPASSNSMGSHIGYSMVVEKRSDGSYTQYAYSNFTAGNGDPGHLDEPPINQLQVNEFNDNDRILYAPYSSTQEERGKLIREESFNSVGQRVRQKTVSYVAFNKNTESVRSVNYSNSQPCDSYSPAVFTEGASYLLYTYSYLPVQETETIYDANGANGLTTVRAISYNSRRLVQSETKTDSKGINLETQYKYCFDFPYTGPQPSIPLTRGMASMSDKNMVGYPIQTLRLRNGKIIGATVALFSENQSGQVLPSQVLELPLNQPLNVTQYTQPNFSGPSSSNSQQFVTDIALQPKLTFNSYDDIGNVQGLAKEGNQLSCYQWGYSKSLLVAKTANASPNEVFSSNFEEDKAVATAAPDVPGTWNTNGYLKFEEKPSDPMHPSTRKAAHTGQLAGAMYTTQGAQAHAFSTTLRLSAQPNSRRYIFSGWVYTNGPAASIWLFPNLPSAQKTDGTINYYEGAGNSARPELFPSYASTEVNTKPDQIGRWVYLQKEVEIPGDVTLLTLRITNFWNGAGDYAARVNGGGVWFDDVRMHPAEAQMVTYTHDPLTGPTSVSDANNQPTYYEYDGLQRLQLVKDRDGNVLKHLEYHYQQ